MRVEELQRVLESYGYIMKRPSSGGSHCTFRKPGYPPITIPQNDPIKKVYVIMVKEIIENEVSEDENT